MLELQIKALRRYEDSLTLLGLAVLCFLLFFYGLGNIGFLGPDEPRYSAIAHEMLRSHDFITPRLNGSPWFEKPVLLYWGSAIGYAIFGVGEFAARLPSAVAASACVFMLYYCGRRLWDRYTGLLCALVMASSIGFFVFGRAASTDMLLTACLTLAFCSFLLGSNFEGRTRRRWFSAFYFFLGLGVLAKGPIALLLPGASLFGYLLFRRRLGEWKGWHPGRAWIAIAVAAPWYIACTLANGSGFTKEFFLNHNFQRFTTNLYGHPRPFYFYLPVLLMLTLPWTFLLISAFRRRFDRSDALLAWWIAVPMIFFSFSVSKLPSYILPVVPAVAMFCARELRRKTSRLFRIAVFLQAGAMIFIGVAFGFFESMLNLNPHIDGMVIAGVSFSIAAVLVIIGLWLSPRILAGFNVLTMVTLVLFGVNFILPRFEQAETMRPWSNALATLVPDDQVVYLYKPQRWEEFGLQFYRSGKAQAIRTPEQMLELTAADVKVICIADNKALDEIAHIEKVDTKVLLPLGDQTAFLVWRTD